MQEHSARTRPVAVLGSSRRRGVGAVAATTREDAVAVRWALIAAAVAVISVLVVVPVVKVFWEALRHGAGMYVDRLWNDADTWRAIWLTLTVAPAAVVLNTLFGLSAAWVIVRFRFPGRALLTALIDLPFAVSPVVAGLVFVLLFGLQGTFGPWLREHEIRIVFATPGLILATAFVTFPFVARELIPAMEALGDEEEVAAVSLGAGAWSLLRRITLPNIKWGLLYGIVLCNARAMGEFGAVSVVSGRITGQTDTLPLRVEKLFQEYDMPGSFAAASLLCGLALVTLAVKAVLERQSRRDLAVGRGGEVGGPLAAPAVPGGSLLSTASFPIAAAAASAPWSSVPAASLRAAKEPRSLSEGALRAAEGSRVAISIRDVSKRFGDFVALDRVSIDVREGSLVALLGPSGSGKTTLLRIIAGLETVDVGSIHYEDVDATHRPAGERNVGFVFQHYALFRQMSVFENVAFGLRVRRWPKKKIEERVHELLRLVQLADIGKLMPSQLSGGQRQRVALARALAAQPRVLLLDEPFGALDAKVRQDLRQWLRKLHEEIHVTSVFVTHDQEEAFEVADRVVVMNRGRIEQVGTPEEVFEHPANAFVMDFLGNVNVFHGRVAQGRARLGGIEVAYPDYPHAEERAVKAYARPHELDLDRLPRGGTSLKARVMRVKAAGPVVKVDLFADDFSLPIAVTLAPDRCRELAVAVGETFFVFPKRLRVFTHDFQI